MDNCLETISVYYHNHTALDRMESSQDEFFFVRNNSPHKQWLPPSRSCCEEMLRRMLNGHSGTDHDGCRVAASSCHHYIFPHSRGSFFHGSYFFYGACYRCPYSGVFFCLFFFYGPCPYCHGPSGVSFFRGSCHLRYDFH